MMNEKLEIRMLSSENARDLNETILLRKEQSYKSFVFLGTGEKKLTKLPITKTAAEGFIFGDDQRTSFAYN